MLALLLVLAAPTSAAANAISTPPRLVAGSITNADYPRASLRNDEQGTTRSQITLDTSGKPTSCRGIGTSGYALLDSNACGVILKRLTFSPALDAEGKPMPATIILPLRWAIH